MLLSTYLMITFRTAVNCDYKSFLKGATKTQKYIAPFRIKHLFLLWLITEILHSVSQTPPFVCYWNIPYWNKLVMPRTEALWCYFPGLCSIACIFYLTSQVWDQSFGQGSGINPLHLDISMQVLHNSLHIFPVVLTKRICLAIKSFLSSQSFSLYLWP